MQNTQLTDENTQLTDENTQLTDENTQLIDENTQLTDDSSRTGTMDCETSSETSNLNSSVGRYTGILSSYGIDVTPVLI